MSASFSASKKIITKIKIKILELFPKWHLHVFFEPFTYLLLNLLYLSKLSKWESQHRTITKDGRTVIYDEKLDLYGELLKSEKLDEEITYLEFGVAEGASLKWWVDHNTRPQSEFVGFDTFEGLPDAWGQYEKGAFSTGGRFPSIQDDRCRFVKGLFQDTLVDELPTLNLGRRVVIHLDADLYSSTIFVLLTLAKKLKKNDILIFDEFSSPLHEFRAFEDFITAMSYSYEFLGCTLRYSQVVIKIT